MTSNSGFHSQGTDYARRIQEVLDELRQMQQPLQLVTSPAELEALVQPAGITQRVLLVAVRRISRAVWFSYTSIESVSDAH